MSRVPSIVLVCAFLLFPALALAGYSEEGVALWYGEEFQGKPTASGEVFDPTDLTAAHKMLPFGTVVQVTNLDNGLAVTVRINDRGPFRPGCVIDLSMAAAEQIAMKDAGTARVRLDVLGMIENHGQDAPPDLPDPGLDQGLTQDPDQEVGNPEPETVVSQPSDGPAFVVQVASFSDPDKAAAIFEQLLAQGFSSASIVNVLIDGTTMYRVRAGAYSSLDAAQADLPRVRAAFPDAFVAQGP